MLDSHHCGRVLARIAEHEVGLPLGDGLLHRRQHRVGGQPAEELSIAEDRCLVRGKERELFADRRDGRLRRFTSDSERMTASANQVGQTGWRDHQRVVTAVTRGVEQRQQGLKVARTTKRTRGKDAHAGDLMRGART